MMNAGLSSGVVALTAWYLAALVVSAALVPLCRKIARRHGYVARPRDDRWHRKSTPLLGGLAIALTALGLTAVPGYTSVLLPAVIGGGLMFIVGVADDVRRFKPSTKLIAEIAIASLLLVFFDDRLNWTTLPILDTLLTLVWLVGVTNAFNLLDNMDGLCAGVVLIAGFWMLIALFCTGRART